MFDCRAYSFLNTNSQAWRIDLLGSHPFYDIFPDIFVFNGKTLTQSHKKALTPSKSSSCSEMCLCTKIFYIKISPVLLADGGNPLRNFSADILSPQVSSDLMINFCSRYERYTLFAASSAWPLRLRCVLWVCVSLNYRFDLSEYVGRIVYKLI